MSEQKFLNLDSFAESEEVVVQLKDKRHVMKAMSVKDFLWTQQKIKEAEKATQTAEENTNTTIEILTRQFPTMAAEDLLNVPYATLNKLCAFVASIGAKGAEAAVENAAAEEASSGEESPAVTQSSSTSDISPAG